MLCLCVLLVWILCVDGRSRYLYIVLGGFLRILLHLIDICFLTCSCLWQISQILICLCVVVGPGLVSTSPAFIRSITSHPAGLHGWFAQKSVIGREGSTQFAQGLPDRCNSSTTCRLCCLEPIYLILAIISVSLLYGYLTFYCSTNIKYVI